MELAENEKSKKLQRLLEQKRKIEQRKQKIEEQIKIEEEKIKLKLGKVTGAKKKQYQKMKQAYSMRQDGLTFVEIGKHLDISASHASKLCQTYSMLMELLESRKQM